MPLLYSNSLSKYYIVFCIYLFLPCTGFCQQGQLKKQVDSLIFVTNMPFMCHGHKHSTAPERCQGQLFWSVVKYKLDAVPLLIDKMTDTTTTAAWAGIQGGQYTVADIAYRGISEIIDSIPQSKLMGVKYPESLGGDNYWRYVRSSVYNRRNFQSALRDWFLQNKLKLVWVPGMQVLTCECDFDHPNGGHYVVSK